MTFCIPNTIFIKNLIKLIYVKKIIQLGELLRIVLSILGNDRNNRLIDEVRDSQLVINI